MWELSNKRWTYRLRSSTTSLNDACSFLRSITPIKRKLDKNLENAKLSQIIKDPIDYLMIISSISRGRCKKLEKNLIDCPRPKSMPYSTATSSFWKRANSFLMVVIFQEASFSGTSQWWRRLTSKSASSSKREKTRLRRWRIRVRNGARNWSRPLTRNTSITFKTSQQEKEQEKSMANRRESLRKRYVLKWTNVSKPR